MLHLSAIKQVVLDVPAKDNIVIIQYKSYPELVERLVAEEGRWARTPGTFAVQAHAEEPSAK